MSTWSTGWTRPKWVEQPNDEYGDCCGQRPTILYAKRQHLTLVQCARDGCQNADPHGVLASPSDAVAKWNRFRAPATSPE